MTIKRLVFFFGVILFVLLGGQVVLNLLGGGILLELATNTVTSRTLSCAELPTTAEAETVVGQYAELFDQIEALKPNFVSVHVSPEEECPGRATLTIAYATENDREAIEAILSQSGGRSRPAPWEPPRLFGIPYRLVNT